MKMTKRRRLEAAGWRVGDASNFLHLSAEEAALVELKLGLSRLVKRLRARRGQTQSDVARRMRSSQSRIAKIEAADASVSLDLLVRAALALGATRADLARAISRRAA